MRNPGAERGITLIEVATVMVVTFALVGALAPTLSAVVRHAEQTAATGQMQKIATQIVTMLDTDLNFTRFTTDGTRTGPFVNVLVTDGDTPLDASLADDNGAAAGVQLRWDDAVNNADVDFLERHMVLNEIGGNPAVSYTTTATNYWKGAYLTSPLDPDPWGNRYVINGQFLGPNSNDVVVYSSGPDEEIDSLFEANPLSAADDDLVVLVQS